MSLRQTQPAVIPSSAVSKREAANLQIELAEGLRLMGGEIDEQPDGFHVRGRRRLRGGEVDAKNDHRLAMAFAIAALGATGPTIIHDAGAAAVSYPDFFNVLESLRV